MYLYVYKYLNFTKAVSCFNHIKHVLSALQRTRFLVLKMYQ